MRDCFIDLITISYVKNTGDIGQGTRTETKNRIAATEESISRDEFFAASQSGLKQRRMFTVWQFEYSGQTLLSLPEELDENGRPKRYTIYRTFDRAKDEKTELYCEVRAGNG